MFKFIETIMSLLPTLTEEERIEATNNLKPVADNMEEVGTLSPHLLNLWTLSVRWGGELKELTAKIADLSEEGSIGPLEKEAKVLSERLNGLIQLFWSEIREEYVLWDEDRLGIRGDSRVVKIIYPICKGCGRSHAIPKVEVTRLDDFLDDRMEDFF